MDEQEIAAVWTTVREFVSGLHRRDPTVRRWLVPRGDVAMLLDLYGESALLTLLKDYLDKERFALVRIGKLSEQESHVRLAEVAWVAPNTTAHTEEDLVTLQLRMYRRRWRVEDLWPSSMDNPLTVEGAREIVESLGEESPFAVIWTAGGLALPMEGHAELDDVEALVVAGMDTRGFSPREVVRAVRLWRDFRRQARPIYRKPAVFAAAVEYACSLLGFYGDTQKEMAAYYGISPGSVAARFHEIRDCLHLAAFDPRYSALEGPSIILSEVRQTLGLPSPPQLKLGRWFSGFWES